MKNNASHTIIEAISRHARPCDQFTDLDPLVERIQHSKIVMLGEASHGTHEYYTWRAQLTKRLIAEKGFSFIAVEGDWPDCFKVNRYVKGHETSYPGAYNLLHSFTRWPSWMWANLEVTEFTEWLKNYNDKKPAEEKSGFYGLDVYSLWKAWNL